MCLELLRSNDSIPSNRRGTHIRHRGVPRVLLDELAPWTRRCGALSPSSEASGVVQPELGASFHRN